MLQRLAQFLSSLRLMLQSLAQFFGSRVFPLQRLASSWRSSAFVCACLATDVFTTGRRSFALLFLEPFLVVLAINKKTETEMLVAGETRSMTGSGTPWQQAPPAAELTFTSGG